jgi:hypothetical protein
MTQCEKAPIHRKLLASLGKGLAPSRKKSKCLATSYAISSSEARRSYLRASPALLSRRPVDFMRLLPPPGPHQAVHHCDVVHVARGNAPVAHLVQEGGGFSQLGKGNTSS